MTLFDRLRSAPFWLHVVITLGLSSLLVSMFRVAPWLSGATQKLYVGLGFPESEAIFLTRFTVVSWLSGIGLFAVLWLVVRIEQPADWKSFLLLDRSDWRGFGLLLAIRGAIALLELWFLNRLLWQPIQSGLMSLGLWTEAALPAPPRQFLPLNLLVLTAMSWLEIPEEIYFRGYLQPQLTRRLGRLRGIGISLLLWDAWHLWNPAMFVRRFVITLPDAIIVDRRRRVWAPLIAHPLGNRLLVTGYLLMPGAG